MRTKPAKNNGDIPNARAMNNPSAGFSKYCAIKPMANGTGL